MTCHQTLALLDDYIDGELSPQQVAQTEEHLKTCPDCRHETELARQIKASLAELPDIDPGRQYWDETTQLITARTASLIESDSSETINTAATPEEKTAFFRSLASVAASILILIGAIYLGGAQQKQARRINPPASPYFVAVSLHEAFTDDKVEFVTSKEATQITKGMILMGAPGTLGRLALLPELASSFHQE